MPIGRNVPPRAHGYAVSNFLEVITDYVQFIAMINVTIILFANIKEAINGAWFTWSARMLHSYWTLMYSAVFIRVVITYRDCVWIPYPLRVMLFALRRVVTRSRFSRLLVVMFGLAAVLMVLDPLMENDTFPRLAICTSFLLHIHRMEHEIWSALDFFFGNIVCMTCLFVSAVMAYLHTKGVTKEIRKNRTSKVIKTKAPKTVRKRHIETNEEQSLRLFYKVYN